MANCLKNYVGLLNCQLPEPKSGLYINDLPGIETELVAAITSKEADSFLSTWDKINTVAYNRLKADVSKGFIENQKINFSQVVYQTNKPSIRKPAANLIMTDAYAGVVITVPYSRYGKIRINKLFLFNSGALEVTTTLKVIDTVTGVTLLERAAVLSLGLNVIDVDWEYDIPYGSLSAFVGVDTTGLTLLQLTDNEYYWTDLSGCECVCSYTDTILQVYPASGTLLEPIRTAHAGVYVAADIGCSLDAYLCENKQHFAPAWQYLLAHELLKHKIASPRLNFYAQSNLERTAESRDEFMADYQTHLKRAMATVPTYSDMCYNCEGVSGLVYASLV